MNPGDGRRGTGPERSTSDSERRRRGGAPDQMDFLWFESSHRAPETSAWAFTGGPVNAARPASSDPLDDRTSNGTAAAGEVPNERGRQQNEPLSLLVSALEPTPFAPGHDPGRAAVAVTATSAPESSSYATLAAPMDTSIVRAVGRGGEGNAVDASEAMVMMTTMLPGLPPRIKNDNSDTEKQPPSLAHEAFAGVADSHDKAAGSPFGVSQRGSNWRAPPPSSGLHETLRSTTAFPASSALERLARQINAATAAAATTTTTTSTAATLRPPNPTSGGLFLPLPSSFRAGGVGVGLPSTQDPISSAVGSGDANPLLWMAQESVLGSLSSSSFLLPPMPPTGRILTSSLGLDALSSDLFHARHRAVTSNHLSLPFNTSLALPDSSLLRVPLPATWQHDAVTAGALSNGLVRDGRDEGGEAKSPTAHDAPSATTTHLLLQSRSSLVQPPGLDGLFRFDRLSNAPAAAASAPPTLLLPNHHPTNPFSFNPSVHNLSHSSFISSVPLDESLRSIAQEDLGAMAATTSLLRQSTPLPSSPPQPMGRLRQAMHASDETQKLLQDWDKLHGLPKSHSSTMVCTSRSRRQLLENRILPKWDGTPLISKEGRPEPKSRPRKRLMVTGGGAPSLPVVFPRSLSPPPDGAAPSTSPAAAETTPPKGALTADSVATATATATATAADQGDDDDDDDDEASRDDGSSFG